jgi:cobalt-zinc-cadmium resistance protein CzcA
MLNKIIQLSVRNKMMVALGVLGLVIYGVIELFRLPIDAVPDITDNQVQIITVSPSMGAPDVERLITFPVEHINSNIPGLKEIRSFSRFGLSVVTIVFNENVDVYWARQQVSERLQQVKSQIPAGAGEPELAPVTTGLGEIYQYVVRPKSGYEKRFSLRELRTIQDWNVRRQLLGTEGVADVSSFGGELKQFEVALEPGRLAALNVSITEIFSALEKSNSNAGGSYIEKGPNAFFIRTEGLLGDMEGIKQVVIKAQADGTPLLLRDVAEVRESAARRYGAMTFNDKGEVAGAVVMMLKGANSSAVIQKVKDKVEQIKKTLPEGVTIEPFLDRTKMVDNAIGTVTQNLLEGALIVIFVLVLFLGNMRAGLIVASVIPLAMLFAVIMMNLFGVSGNLMSLGALDFGLIIDGAVIIVEAVLHRMFLMKNKSSIRLGAQEMDQIVADSSGKMMNAAVFGQLIILIVYLPILTLQGIEGKMFKPMAQTVTFALAGAFLLSITYVPMMCSWLLRKSAHGESNKSERIFEKLESGYRRILAWSVTKFRVLLISVVVLFAASVFLLSQMGGEFIPQLEEGDFAIETRLLTGSNLKTTIDACSKSSKILIDEFPEVEKVVAKIGSGEIPTDPMPMEAADLMVILKDKREWKSAKSFPELAEKMQAKLEQIPGVSYGFQFPVQMRFNELMTGAKQDVVCKIFGEDLDTLPLLAEKLGKIISQVRGAEDVYIEATGGMPQVVVKFNRMALANYGISLGAANDIIQTAFAGKTAGVVFENERRFDLVLRMKDASRFDPDAVGNLLLQTENGKTVPLSAVADVEVNDGPNQIQREDAKRRIIVGFNVRGRDVQSIVNELRNRVQKEMKMPPGYFVHYGGAFENLQQASKRLAIAVPIALGLIVLLLYLAFGSLKMSALVFSAVPLSAIGGILGLGLRGMPFSISAGVGFIALFGVAVLNGIVLISEYNHLKLAGETHVLQIITKGSGRRLRPVLMTASVASLGFLPMALSNGAGAEVQRPLATVVIAGIVSATLLTLFVVPILYYLTENKMWKQLFGKKKSASLLFIFGLLSCQTAWGQVKSYTLDEALQQAIKNNALIKSRSWQVQGEDQWRQSAGSLAPQQFGFELGQVNSYYRDTRFTFYQDLRLPGWYKWQKNAAQGRVRVAVADSAAETAWLKYEVKSRFYDLILFDEQLKSLKFADSLWNLLVEKMEKKLQAGEISALELSHAKMQVHDLKNQIRQNRSEAMTALNEFRILLADTGEIKAVAPSGVYSGKNSILSAGLNANPTVNKAAAMAEALKAQWRLEQKNALPVLTLGYANMSVVGWQRINNTDRFFNAGQRFHTGSFQMQIPLNYKPFAHHSKAAEYNWRAAEEQFRFELLSADRKRVSAAFEVQQSSARVQEYNSAVLQAEMVLNLAGIKLNKGEIDYTEWILITQSALQIVNKQTELKSLANNAWFKLEYILNQ